MRKIGVKLIIVLSIFVMNLGFFVCDTSAASLPKVKMNSIKLKSGSSVVIYWNKVKNVNGYQVFRSTKKNSQYKKVKTVSNANTSSTTIGNGINGKTYYYKIRTYKKVNNQIKYGPLSSAKSKKMTYYAYKGESTKSKNLRIFNSTSKKKYKSASQAKKYMTTIKIKVWDLNSKKKKVTKTKTLKVHKNIASTVKQIFNEIYHGKEKFPIHAISGYSWRGSGSSSEHNLGLAIDINPNENYMIDGKKILCGKFWKPGKNSYSIKKNGDVVKAMNKYGFKWGHWGNRHDYMHFSFYGN